MIATDTTASRLPLYHKLIDWDALWREYPVPDVFVETIYKWPAERIRELQNRRFLEMVQEGWRNPFYRRRWTAVGLEPGDIRSLDDITRLPMFNSDDIKTDQQEHGPYGEIHNVTRADFAAMPMKVHTSGGTTGKPRAILFAPHEWETQAITAARSLYIQGARPGDVMQIPATCSLANLGWAMYKVCQDYLGIMPVTTGSGVVTPSRRQLEIAFEFDTNIWESFPEYMTTLAKVCREELKRDPRELNTKFISTFLGPDLEGTLRKQLENEFGCPVYDQYGTNEVGCGAFECGAKDGLHFMDDMIYFEIVDTETGNLVAPGETGNLVATVFYRRRPLIIRLNMRDLGRLVSTERCSCGSSFRRMDHFLGRSDDMVKIRGVNIYPMACLPAVKSDPRTTGEWVCVVERHSAGGAIRDDLTVRVEVRQSADSRDGLADHLARRLSSDLGLKVAIELVEEGSLAAAANLGREGKPKRLLDLRKF
jgi:phenylacetate-CoA ligase